MNGGPAGEVVTFGEAMLRLSPPGGRRFAQAKGFEAWVGGAELNTAVSLAGLGHPVRWISRLPANALGEMVDAHARVSGVDTADVNWAPDGRLGLFFVEIGAAPRPSRTVYDRAASAFAGLDPGDFDWPRLLAGARAFHTTGITPALSPGCRQACEEALRAAREARCATSFDVNFRALLNTPEEARERIERLAPTIDTLIASSGDVEQLFGLCGADVAARLRDRLGIERVVVSSRVDHADGTQSRRSVCAGTALHTADSPAFATVDPLGGGDAFSAGVIAGLLEDGVQRALELGGALAALKQSVLGDSAPVPRAEVDELLAGGALRTHR